MFSAKPPPRPPPIFFKGVVLSLNFQPVKKSVLHGSGMVFIAVKPVKSECRPVESER